MDRRISSTILALALTLAGAACSGSSGLDFSAPAPSASSLATQPAAVTGLPCDVAKVVVGCATCHGSPPTGGAPNSILSYADLTAPSMSDPAESVCALSIARMRDAKRPMPPDAMAAPADVSTLEAWIAAGAPHGTCDTPVPSSTNTNTPLTCTSGKTWTRGNRGSSSMHPGVACIDCHAQGEGPSYTAAGTVYPTAHEPDDCDGLAGVTVVITDATGQAFQARANSVGNFSMRYSLTPPLHVKVVSGSNTRAMNGAVTSGDCNGCHTASGTQNAPGRIMAP